MAWDVVFGRAVVIVSVCLAKVRVVKQEMVTGCVSRAAVFVARELPPVGGAVNPQKFVGWAEDRGL